MANCPRCGTVVAGGCQCTFEDSSCIEMAVVGDGATPTLIIDPDLDNIVECRPTGLYAAMADRFTIPTVRKVRSTTLAFNNNDALTYPTLEYDYAANPMSLSTSEVEIPFDGKYRITAYLNTDNNTANYNTLRLEVDTGGGYGIISASRESRDTGVVHESFITHVDEMDFDAGDLLRMTLGENASGSVSVLRASFVVSFASL